MNTARTDIHDSVTARIVAQLEQGIRPWARPWNAEHAAGRITRPLRFNGEPYRGVNVLMLWMTAEEKGYSAPLWLTFQQCKQLGGCVKAGEKSSPVIYCRKIQDEEEDREFFLTRTYNVFNAEQTHGLPEHYYRMASPQIDPVERNGHAEQFFTNTGAQVSHGGNAAFYSPSDDRIQMPPFIAFRDAESYYSTLAHECTHWTKGPNRLVREFGRKKFGDSGYAREELVAEIGAAFLCVDLGLTPEPREDHAGYLAHWLAVLKEDNRAIFQAAAFAQKAADYLHGLQPQPAP